MFPPRPTHLLHLLLRDFIQAGDLVMDATAGNGYDTVFLAEAVGEGGSVIAVDLQSEAIESTRKRLIEEGLDGRVELHQVSHAELGRFAAPDSVAAIVFNLGYLPGCDHSIITEKDATLAALAESVWLLKPGGALAVVCYPGHEGGDREAESVEDFLTGESRLRLAKYQMLATRKVAPFLLMASKRP